MLFPTNICGSELGKFALRSRSAIAVLAISKGVGEGICAARAQEKREVNPVDQRIRQARFHDSLMV